MEMVLAQQGRRRGWGATGPKEGVEVNGKERLNEYPDPGTNDIGDKMRSIKHKRERAAALFTLLLNNTLKRESSKRDSNSKTDKTEWTMYEGENNKNTKKCTTTLLSTSACARAHDLAVRWLRERGALARVRRGLSNTTPVSAFGFAPEAHVTDCSQGSSCCAAQNLPAQPLPEECCVQTTWRRGQGGRTDGRTYPEFQLRGERPARIIMRMGLNRS
ncbi:hypothetical protein C8R44DRAFT_753788 [Mycena epipterygia]|nr:hypothetical protein C8R44DRAFT_753788 [Mycena epipterygia]